jgi:hypothetical protein
MSIIVVVVLVRQYVGIGVASRMLFEQEINQADITEFTK